MGLMLVRVFNKNCTTGTVTLWNDDWLIGTAMEEWLVDGLWFEILGYYPNEAEWDPYVDRTNFVVNFKKAEKRANYYVNRQ
jgi:hypothetical protein